MLAAAAAAAAAAGLTAAASPCAAHADAAHCYAFRLQQECVWDETAGACLDDLPCDTRSAERCEFELTPGSTWDATQNKCFLGADGVCRWSDLCYTATDGESCEAASCRWQEMCTPKDMRYAPGPGVCRFLCTTPGVTLPGGGGDRGGGGDSLQNSTAAAGSKLRRLQTREDTSPRAADEAWANARGIGRNKLLDWKPERENLSLTGVVTTQGGFRMRGLRNEQVELYLGVPFAAAPVGSLRWRPPVDLDASSSGDDDVFNATDFGAGCMRASAGYDLFNDGSCNGFTRDSAGAASGACAGYSEDCLSLNVYAPAGSTTNAAKRGAADKRAVMVWIHGGCFVAGQASSYNGTTLAINENVIVVTVSYRLASFGFLAHDALRPRDETWGSTGNYGLLDNVAALKWIQNNIASLGGDPDRVTIFGESSGAGSVSQLLGAPMAW
jgi:hypothetical protein